MNILTLLHSGFSAIGPFVILLGLLIFVHEMGHFAVAKWCGVRVETFSLGFGKKIFKFVRGETTYCLSIVPLGGYVKMYGDDVTAEIPESEKKRAFLHKNVWQRIAIVLAGPLMNLFFAFFIFLAIAFIGEDAQKPLLGDVEEASKAFVSGFRSGDQIRTVNGEAVHSWEAVQKVLNRLQGGIATFEVSRYGHTDGLQISSPVESTTNPNLLSLDDTIGTIDGMATYSKSPQVSVHQGSKAYEFGLRTGDEIEKLDGATLTYFRDLEPKLVGLQHQTVSIEINREEAGVAKHQTLRGTLPAFSALKVFGLSSMELHIQSIVKNSPAEKAGFLERDKMLQIAGQPVARWQDVLDTIKSYSGSDPLSIKVERESPEGISTLDLSVVPEMTKQMTMSGSEDKRYTIGIVPFFSYAGPQLVKIRSTGLLSGIERSLQKTYDISVMTVLSFVRLIQNKISPKNIGGVLSIGQAASETFKLGLSQFLQMMAVISINLFILNLLPVPVLDGGHLLFYSIEALRGAPLSMKKMEIAQQIGLVLLMSLMAFALFNDFSRLFGKL